MATIGPSGHVLVTRPTLILGGGGEGGGEEVEKRVSLQQEDHLAEALRRKPLLR